MEGKNSRAAGENRSEALVAGRKRDAGISQDVSELIHRGRISDMKLENYHSLAHWAECTRPYSDAVNSKVRR